MIQNASLNILVVDDNKDSAQTLGMMLELLGHKVQLAHDGPQALQSLKTFTPQTVLLDIGLPGMNGYEVCQRMRQEPGLEKTVFIAQTGWGDEQHRELSRQAGFHHHLVKPVEIEVLRQILCS